MPAAGLRRIGVELLELDDLAAPGMLGKAADEAELAIGQQRSVRFGEAIEPRRIGEFGGDGRFGMGFLEIGGQVLGPIHVAELGDEAVDAEPRQRGDVGGGGGAQDHRRWS